MKVDYQDLADNSRIWIYQSSIFLDDARKKKLVNELQWFLENWTSHSQELKTFGDVLHGYFVVLAVDQRNSYNASGCSIDSSIHFIKNVGAKISVDFFDRKSYAFYNSKKVIETVHHNDLKEYYQKEIIQDHTLFFNNLVKTKEEFDNHWLVPLKDSWHYKFV